MNRFEYVTPKSLEEAVKLLPAERAGTFVKAGGTDLVSLMKDRVLAPRRLVNLLGLDLRSISAKDSLAVGALVTLAELAASADVRAKAKALAEAAGEAATPQVRNMATVGGNLCQRPRCWYFRNDAFPCAKREGGSGCSAREGDNRYHAIFANEKCCAVHPSNLAPALLALEGSVHVVGPKGARSVLAEAFFDVKDDVLRENTLAPDEIVAGIEVPAGAKSVYLELRERQSFDWPLVSVAAASRNGKTRLVLGAVAPRPWVCSGTDVEAILKAAKPLRDNGYKLSLVRTLVDRALAAL